MDGIPIWALVAALFILVALSAFFSASETAMMALNRYRLRHRAAQGDRRALVALSMLQQPERLLGTILLGNNLANMAAASVATVIALKLFGEAAIAVATFLMTLVILVFAEVPPKTLAALHPERIAYPVAPLLAWLLRVCRPVVRLVNVAADTLVGLLGGDNKRQRDPLSAEELRSVVVESSLVNIPPTHQDMLVRILDLENITVEDVMVPRARIEAVNLDDQWEDVVRQIITSHHSRLPVYRGTMERMEGILHMRKVTHLLHSAELTPQTLVGILRKPHFIPEYSSLTEQFLTMQKQRRQMGLVVDEYGDIKGLVTMEEIVEEIVGEFTTGAPGATDDAVPQKDGSYLVAGSANVREINRKLNWNLPTDGPKTLNGLILERVEQIPPPGLSFHIEKYPVEIVQTRGTAVTVAKIKAPEGLPETDGDGAGAFSGEGESA